MTNTPMSEREKELVSLVREALGALRDGTNWSLANDLEKALRAYDPKPEPVPVIPAWEEFVKDKPVQQWGIGQAPVAVMVGRVAIHRDHFDVIREALSKPKAPTE